MGAVLQHPGNILLWRTCDSGVSCLPRPRRDSKNWRAPTIRIDPELRGNALAGRASMETFWLSSGRVASRVTSNDSLVAKLLQAAGTSDQQVEREVLF